MKPAGGWGLYTEPYVRSAQGNPCTEGGRLHVAPLYGALLYRDTFTMTVMCKGVTFPSFG